MTALIYILIGLALGFYLGRYRGNSFQNRGEALLSRTVTQQFLPPDYHLMNHITLPLKEGTTQIDHILVSRFGVFVIETKNYKGWIFANAHQASWTQVLFKHKFKFQNPIFQNFQHLRTVQKLLDFLPPSSIQSAVVFTGDAEFRTEIPKGVFSLPGFVEHLRCQTTEVLSANRVQFCVGRLETARLSVTNRTDVEHVQSIQRRYRNAA